MSNLTSALLKGWASAALELGPLLRLQCRFVENRGKRGTVQS